MLHAEDEAGVVGGGGIGKQRRGSAGDGIGVEVICLCHLLEGGALKPIRHHQAAGAVGQNLDIIRHGL